MELLHVTKVYDALSHDGMEMEKEILFFFPMTAMHNPDKSNF